MVTTSYSTMSEDKWRKLASTCSPDHIEMLIASHQGKLDRPSWNATEKSAQEHREAVTALRAAIEERRTVGPQLRALPCMYDPMKALAAKGKQGKLEPVLTRPEMRARMKIEFMEMAAMFDD